MLLLSSADFFQNQLFQKILSGIIKIIIIMKYNQSVKQFGSRSGPTSGTKLLAKVINRWIPQNRYFYLYFTCTWGGHDLAILEYTMYIRTAINKKCHSHVTNAPKGIGQA